MHRTSCCATLVAAIGLWMNLAAQAPTGSPPRSASDLERLTVPGAVLPANCRPSPPGGMFSTNPSVVTAPRRLGIMHGLVFGMSPDLEKAIKAAGRTEAVNLVAESLAASAADVEAGYAASYQEQGGSPEIGVFALLMKKLPAEGASAAQPRSARIIKGPVAIFYWSDARPDAPDLGCLDVVRRHIESVDFR